MSASSVNNFLSQLTLLLSPVFRYNQVLFVKYAMERKKNSKIKPAVAQSLCWILHLFTRVPL